MARTTFNSLEEYCAAVTEALPKVMEEYVAPYVENILRYHIMDDVYGTYTPKPGAWVGGTTYQRRYSLMTNITSRIEGETLITTSTASPGPSILGQPTWGSEDGAFFDLLVSENQGIWRSGFPRPAVEFAQAELDESGRILDHNVELGLEDMLG